MIKSRHTRLLGLAAAVVAMIGTAGVIGAPAASATGFYCASSATIVARTGTGYVAWDGYETRGVLTKFTGKTLTRGAHFYELHGLSIRINFGGDSYTLNGSAVFMLSCSGLSAGVKAIMPSIAMLQGTAVVHTTRAVEGSVRTEEGLCGQVPYSAATAYSVVRVLRQHTALTLTQKIYWYMAYANQPSGTTTAKTLTTALINVTPYVGAGPGHCRHVHWAVLATTSTYGHGSAVYHF
jgi:hypothetical protein